MRRLRNPVVIFGIVIVLLCWAGACLQGFAERAQAIRVAIARGDTAARLFEKDTVSLLKGIDTILLLLRQAYEADPQHFDLIRLADRARTGQRCLDRNLLDHVRRLSHAENDGHFAGLRFTSEIVCIFGHRSIAKAGRPVHRHPDRPANHRATSHPGFAPAPCGRRQLRRHTFRTGRSRFRGTILQDAQVGPGQQHQSSRARRHFREPPTAL